MSDRQEYQTGSPREPDHKRRGAGSVLSIVLAALGVLLLAWYAYTTLKNRPPEPEPPPPASSLASSAPEPVSSEPEPEPESSEPEPEPVLYAVGKLSITPERRAYVDGTMTLRVPRLNLTAPVVNGVTEADLTRGAGLYDYAQPPGDGNCNVSIAGHRDIYGCEFYYIDTLGPGDKIYLDYQGETFTYAYESTEIVEADNWDPIRNKDYSCVTLTSCDPIGTSLRRIIVVGRLADRRPTEEALASQASEEAQASEAASETASDAVPSAAPQAAAGPAQTESAA